MLHQRLSAKYLLAFVAIFLITSPATARDILLIDDFDAGFGATAGILTGAGHTVTELTGEVAGGYSRVSDTAFLSNFDMVVYAARNFDAPPSTANSAMETYIQNGGDLLVTGFQSNIGLPDRSAPELLRAIGPEFSYFSGDVDHVVSGVDNYITNGPFGDFRNVTLSNSNGFDQLFANTGRGTIPLVHGASGQPDKIIFTDLPGSGGSIGAWQGGSRVSNEVAQTDFVDGGTFQGMLLNWAEGGTTSHTEVTPRVFSTAAHPLASTIAVDLYLGDPNNGGGLAGVLEPIEIEGTVDLVATIDGSGNGTLAITSSSMIAAGVNDVLANFGILGTALTDVESLEIYLANQIVPVTGNAVDIVQSSYYSVGLTEAFLSVHSPTGPLEGLVENIVPIEVDRDELFYAGPGDFVDPVFSGTFDEGSGLFTPRPELNLIYDDVALFLINIPGLGDLWGVMRGEVHVAYVPEPSGWILGVMGSVGLLAVRRRLRTRDEGIAK